MLDKSGSKFKDYAPFMLRLGLGVIFIVRGSRSLAHLDSSPHLGHLLQTALELVGGLFVLIGLFTREAALGLGCVILWEIIRGPGFRVLHEHYDQFYFACLMMSGAIFLVGAGRWSVDQGRTKKS